MKYYEMYFAKYGDEITNEYGMPVGCVIAEYGDRHTAVWCNTINSEKRCTECWKREYDTDCESYCETILARKLLMMSQRYRPVLKLDLNGNLLAKYNSCQDARRKEHLSDSTMSKYCRGELEAKRTRKCIFIYEDLMPLLELGETMINLVTTPSPCERCRKRTAGCHDICGAYKKWKTDVEEIKSKRRKAIDADYEYWDYANKLKLK